MTGDKRSPGRSREVFLSILIPVVSFGGIGLAVLLQYLGIISDAGTFAWGPAAGGFLLGYLAYIKPRRDIVSLFAPVYAILMFVIPLEIAPNLLLQFLFALSITILVIRLERNFSTPAPNAVPTGGDPMEAFLTDYIEKMRGVYRDLGGKAGHECASAFFSFKFGLYEKTINAVDKALPLLSHEEPGEVLKIALQIVKERAKNLVDANAAPTREYRWTADQAPYLAVVLPPEEVEDETTLDLDNALLLLYVVSWVSSPDDEQALEEHRKYVIQIIGNYQKALGI